MAAFTLNGRKPAHLNDQRDASPDPGKGPESQLLFLLCGLPFSGKSTIGQALQDRLGIVHVEVDRHHSGGHAAAEGRRIERDEWIAAYRAAYREVETALTAGRSVTFDAVSFRRTQRDRMRRIADKFGVPLIVIYLDVPAELANARRVANRCNPMRVDVPDADFIEIEGGMQRPGDDEAQVRYRPPEPLDQWIERVIKPLMKETTS